MNWASQQPTWAIGFQDEVWWSRFALPRIYAWQDAEHPIHLEEQSWQKGDPDPKALACYGVLWQQGPIDDPVRQEMSLRFVTGRPVSDITTQFLEWCCTQVQEQGKTAWLLIWDNASWHNSKKVRSWIREHNLLIKKEKKGVRILPLFLPKQSPWLNPIEPKWVHGKSNVVETSGLLTAKQLAERVCAGKLAEGWDANTGLRASCPNLQPKNDGPKVRHDFQSSAYCVEFTSFFKQKMHEQISASCHETFAPEAV